ncbi:MAG: hypothetical protein CVU61_08230 [Deltaproteobacteria bacterium HGW-Deltaproteobacteria-19]|jgi:hypothetical protein|nr:MAG: hypothetical protein CVU61_08230 [Deltaproteobacteria bacterium HGW-Deltaproteobacteria-19]
MAMTGNRSSRFIVFMLIVWIALGFPAAPATAFPEEKPVREYDLKAAFLYNLLKFVNWPDQIQARSHLVIGILGEDPFGASIEVLKDKMIGRRRIFIRRGLSLQALKRCDVLFVSRSESEKVERVVRSAFSTHTLVVGDTAGFAERGVMINFFLHEKKVRFEINVDTARRAKLTVSSQVLKLGRVIQE